MTSITTDAPNVHAIVTGINNGTINGTFNNHCCPSSGVDFTTYIRMALAMGMLYLLKIHYITDVDLTAFFLCMVLASGFCMVSSSFRELASAVRHRRSAPHNHLEGNAGLDCTEGVEDPHGPDKCQDTHSDERMASLEMPEGDCGEHEGFRTSRQSPSSSPSPGKKSSKMWKKVRKAVFAEDGWAMRAATVAVGCLVGAAPSLQVSLPAPATAGRRSE